MQIKSLFSKNVFLAVKPFSALKESFREGYGKQKLIKDIIAGLTVGVIAIPLSMALAIASGVPPQHGLYTAIVAGIVIALTGGSRFNISGPTAAFVVILYPVTQQFGLSGLLMATLLSGIILVIMALSRLGRLIEYIPLPVTLGFTCGIGITIGTLQIKDFLGLDIAQMPSHNIETANVAELGPLLEGHERFPERVNAGFMQVVNRSHIKLRVYERGAGETQACGSGACAAAAVGIMQGLLDNKVQVDLPGGSLLIEWEGVGSPLYMTGDATHIYDGNIHL